MREWLIDFRKKSGLPQKAIAKEAGISQPAYCTIESGKINPSPKTAKRIADVLGFDWTLFFEEKAGQ